MDVFQLGISGRHVVRLALQRCLNVWWARDLSELIIPTQTVTERTYTARQMMAVQAFTLSRQHVYYSTDDIAAIINSSIIMCIVLTL
ncbi:hypothetical protein J6590_054226 [Homalodisca vitripennis]|nr:hypothetical protein J6590_054226 [Homalodisca vitripennis]